MNKYTEIIEKYLSGSMTAEERISFEKQLKTDTELQAEVALQKQVLQGIKRAGLRTEVKKGFRNGSAKSKGIKFLKGIVITALATTLVFIAKDKLFDEHENNVRYELNEVNKAVWSDADKHLSPELFEIDGTKDTVVETNGGIILSIPAGAFLNEKGDVSKNVELEIKAALDPLSIMKAGLSTTSDGKLLETGGMFYINGREKGRNLTIDQSKGIYTSIPDNNPGKDMMLFEGKRMPDGQINWVNPIPFENKLHPVDILSLNFYPPHFLDSVASFGFDIKNKRLTDSIYYSFVCDQQLMPAQVHEWNNYDEDPRVSDSINNVISKLGLKHRTITASALPLDGKKLFAQNCAVCHTTTDQKLTGPGLKGMTKRFPGGRESLIPYILNNEKFIQAGNPYAVKVRNDYGKAAMTVFEGSLSTDEVSAIIDYVEYGSIKPVDNSDVSSCEIEPSRIHAIWDRKWNNTLLATKEFEERLQVIFQTCNHSILDLYIKNMDKNMWEIDKIAATMCNELHSHMFEEFAKRKDGGVSIDKTHMKKLGRYMEEKRKIYHDATVSTLKKMYEKEGVMDLRAMEEFSKHNSEEFKRKQVVFEEELETNMKEAYRQLGKEYRQGRPRNFLSASIVNTGWKNVDAYVFESTVKRTTLNYSDPESGKKAVIKYEPFSIRVSEFEKYDRVVTYLIPNKLSSFQRIPNVNGIFKENLNELFEYGAIVFGFKGNDVYGGQLAVAKPGEVQLSLNKMSESDLRAYRYMNLGAKVNMVSELNYQIFEQKENVRKKAVDKREEIKWRLWPVVFPCYVALK